MDRTAASSAPLGVIASAWVLALFFFAGCGSTSSLRPAGESPPPVAERTTEGWLDRAEERASRVTIHRDGFGVPHVVGETDADAVFGFTYARAEDELDKIEAHYISILGRRAELLGAQGIPWDLLIRRLEIERIARRQYDAAPAEVRAIAEAFADGMNYFLHTRPDASPLLITHYESWHPFASALSMQIGQVQQLLARAASDSSTYTPSTAEPALGTAADGSNVWAIGPSRTATGRAMLFINPHIPIHQPYEGHVISDEGWNMSGGTAYGSGLFPIFGIAENHAWSLTVNYPDVVDLWAETFDHPDDPLKYRYGDRYRDAVEWTDEIAVKTPTGLVTQEVTLRKTHHGPIVSELRGKQYALGVAMLEEGGLLQQWYEMSKASSLAEFKQALSRRALIYHNVMYADRQGNIYYVYNGAIPRRSTRFDWSGTVDGSDPASDWDGYHPFDALPQLENPPSGYLQNCNSSPFTATSEGNLLPGDYPEGLVGGDRDDPRVAMSHALLSENSELTLGDLEALAFDTLVFDAAPRLADLESAFEVLEADDPERSRPLAPAVEELVSWDRRAAVDSVATTLFFEWWERLAAAMAAASAEGTGDAPRDERSIASLEAALASLEERFDTWHVPWGEVNRLQRPGPDEARPFEDDRPSIPIAGAHGGAGLVFTLLSMRPEGEKLRYGVHGHSYVGVVELGDPKRAATILPFGQSRDPESPHHFDQAPLYAAGKMKRTWLTREEVLENTSRSYRPGE